MNLSEPATVVLAPGTAAVLRALVGADHAFTVRQLSRVSGVSAPNTQRIVHRLAEHGLVTTTPAGRSILCRYNDDHLAAHAIRDLVTLRSRMLELLRQKIGEWAVAPVHVSLFGSGARGDGGTGSDLDLLVIRSDGLAPDQRQRWDDQLWTTGEAARAATGNRVSWLELASADLAGTALSDEAIVTEWRRDGILLAGEPLPGLLRRLR